MKKHTPAKMSDRLRPKRLAKSPDSALPAMQPMSALDDVKPCMKSVYSKSEAPLKKACRPFSAPEMTAVS